MTAYEQHTGDRYSDTSSWQRQKVIDLLSCQPDCTRLYLLGLPLSHTRKSVMAVDSDGPTDACSCIAVIDYAVCVRLIVHYLRSTDRDSSLKPHLTHTHNPKATERVAREK